MSELDVLRDLPGQLPPPAYDDVVTLARKRRRRSTAGVLAGTVAAVLAVGIVQASLLGDKNAVQPAPAPSPSRSTLDDVSLERILTAGAPLDLLDHGHGLAGHGGPETQLYCVSDLGSTESPCNRYHPYDPAENQLWALEVSQADRSAFFEVSGTPLVKDFDLDSVLVLDGTGQAPRYRLLQADGTSLQLRLGDPAPAAPGPDVMLIQDLDVYRSGMVGGDGPQEPPYLVDAETATLRPLAVPAQVEWWGPNVDEFLWGGNGCRVFWQQPDGSFAQHDTDCGDPQGYTTPGWNAEEAVAGWLEPGRMVIVEWGDNGAPKVVHASPDWGVTWERVEIENRKWGDSVEAVNDAVADALREVEERG